MQLRYQATLERPLGRAVSHTVHTRRFRTRRAARLWAERVLDRHPTVDTRAGCLPWQWSVCITDVRRGVDREWVEAPLVLVPSVGEQGWTP